MKDWKSLLLISIIARALVKKGERDERRKTALNWSRKEKKEKEGKMLVIIYLFLDTRERERETETETDRERERERERERGKVNKQAGREAETQSR